MMRSRFAVVIIFIVVTWVAGCGDRETSRASDVESAPATEVALPRSELHLIPSESVGDTFRVSIALPSSYQSSEKRYPVVYALDANAWAWFGTYAEIVRVAAAVEKLPEVIVVGVGYARPVAEALALRARDLTPVSSDEQDERIREAVPGLPGSVVSGGANTFLTLLDHLRSGTETG